MQARRPLAALAAACLVVGLAAFAPSAVAAPAQSGDSAKAKSAQNTRTINRRLNTARRQLSTTRRQVATARRQLRTLTTNLAALGRRIGSAEGGVGTLLGAAPQLISSLQALGAAVQNQIGPGLTTLANTVRDTIGPGLQRVGDFVAAQEYGAARIFIEKPAQNTPFSRSPAVVSADIPDSGNPTPANGTLPIAVTPTANDDTYPTQVHPGAEIYVRASIRSNEADGAASGDPAGQVGGILTVTCGGGGGAGGCGDEGTAAGQAEFDEGQVVCVLGPTNENSFPVPGGTTNQNLVNIQEKVALTAFDHPTLDLTGSVNPLTDLPADTNPLSDTTGGKCTLPSFGVYTAQVQMNFVDIPTSATPGPKD